MSTIVTRAGKGSALTYNEVDSNFTNLNNDKYQSGDALGTPASGNLTNCTFPTLNQDTTGNAATATYATSAGNASTVTNGVYTSDIGSTVLAYDSNLQSFVNTFTLPTTDSTSGYVLATNGSGVLSFVEQSGGGGAGTVTSVSGTGTVNGITLTGTVTSSGSLTLGGTLGSIANSQLTNSSVTFNGQSVALGASGTITANTTNALTVGTGLTFSSGTTFNGSAALTITNSAPMTYAGAGIAVSTGSAWTTSLTAPSGAIVGTTDTQTLSGKTITGTKETVYAITDGAAFEIDPANGGIQTITLGASRTPKGTNFTAGQSVTLMVDDGSAYTITWTDSTFGTSGVSWIGGSAPTLATTGYTVIELWKVGSQVYGAYVGAVA